MIQERITVIQTEDDAPHDFLSILVQAYCESTTLLEESVH